MTDYKQISDLLDEQQKSPELLRAEAKAQAELFNLQAQRGDKEYSQNVTELAPHEQQTFDKAAGKAQAINTQRQQTEEAEALAEQNSLLFRDLDNLPPSQRLAKIEAVAWPELKRLKAEFVKWADLVEDLNHDSQALLNDQIEYCVSGKHPKTKHVIVETPSMRNVYLESGKLRPEGFRIVSDTLHPGGLSKVLFLANDVEKLSDLFDSEEAKAYAKAKHEPVLKRAQEKHKAAAKAFADYKKLVREAIEAVPTLDQLLKKF